MEYGEHAPPVGCAIQEVELAFVIEECVHIAVEFSLVIVDRSGEACVLAIRPWHGVCCHDVDARCGRVESIGEIEHTANRLSTGDTGSDEREIVVIRCP